MACGNFFPPVSTILVITSQPFWSTIKRQGFWMLSGFASSISRCQNQVKKRDLVFHSSKIGCVKTIANYNYIVFLWKCKNHPHQRRVVLPRCSSLTSLYLLMDCKSSRDAYCQRLYMLVYILYMPTFHALIMIMSFIFRLTSLMTMSPCKKKKKNPDGSCFLKVSCAVT